MKGGFALCAAWLVAGCGSSSTVSSSPLAGLWIYQDPSTKSPPSAFEYTLRVLPDGSFLMGGGTAPTRVGKVVIQGDKFVLTPSHLVGTADSSKSKIPGMSPMTATMEPTGEDITVNGSEKGTIRFRRQRKPKAGARTVSAEEEKIVGRYSAELEWDKVPKESKDLLTDLQRFFYAEFRSDNRFTLWVTFNLEGTWHVKSGKLVCNFTSSDQAVVLDFKDGILRPPPTGDKPSPYFFKKD